MRILLDTHVFIWWDSEPELLSQRAREFCENPNNTLVLSVMSVWEMQIKRQIGKLNLRMPLNELIENQKRRNGLEILPVHLDHVLRLEKLPAIHKDPFDRLLIAQAKIEDIKILTSDRVFVEYDVVL